MPTKPPLAAKPSKEVFDPFNSSATGHQRAENRLSGSTLWRDSRHRKLREQFNGGAGGGARVADTVGAGSDGDLKMGLNENGTVTWFRANDQPSLQETLKIVKNVERPAKRLKLDGDSSESTKVAGSTTPLAKSNAATKKSAPTSPNLSPSHFLSPIDPTSSFPDSSNTTAKTNDAKEEPEAEASKEKQYPRIFANLTVYINGCTAPAISDHKLRHLLTKHGANLSIALGRRTVTHVIIGRPGSKGGSGGGLSGSKIQKEIASKQAECVKYVTAEWVLESIKAGKRLPERNFAALRLAPNGMGSVASMFGVAGKKAASALPVKKGQG